MPCESFNTSEGSFLVCRGRGRRKKCSVKGCSAIADYACDYPVGDGKTCDRALCRDHAIKQLDRAPFPWHIELPGANGEPTTVRIAAERGDSIDFCPEHDAAAHADPAPAKQGELFPSTLALLPRGSR